MKQHINLLTEDLFLEPGAISLRVQAQYAAIPILIMLSLALYGWKAVQTSILSSEVQTLRTTKDQLTQEVAGITTRLEEVLAKERQIKEAHLARERRMQELATKRILWSAVFREISLLMPEGVVLSSVSNGQGGTEPEAEATLRSLHFKGLAVSHEAVTTLLSSLERSELFRDPHLSHAQRAAGEEKGNVSFEMIGTLKQAG